MIASPAADECKPLHLHAVMSGRGDEVIDLAKTNLLPR
jgi:hypothetical protein